MHSKAEDYVTPSSRSDDHQVSRSVRGHPCCLGWADLAEGRLCLDHLPAMADRRLSSPARARIPRDGQENLRHRVGFGQEARAGTV